MRICISNIFHRNKYSIVDFEIKIAANVIYCVAYDVTFWRLINFLYK